MLRFGAIENIDEVRQFFSDIPSNGLHYLREVSKPRARVRVIEMEFDGSERQIKIMAGKVSQSLVGTHSETRSGS
jgi:hypothetical protein